MFSSTEERYYAGGAALLLLLQPSASRASTPTSGSKEVFSTQGGRTVWKYTVKNAAEKMGTEEGIVRLKEWAVVHDLGVVFPRASWEIWVAGELKDTVFSERAAEEELRKYLSGEYTDSATPPEKKALPPETPQPPQGRNKNSAIWFFAIIGVLLIIGVLVYGSLATSSSSSTSSMQTVPSSASQAQDTDVTATASASQNPYMNSGTLVLDDPLNDNSRGYQWEEGERDGGSCTFTGGTYHTIIPQAGVFHSCLARSKNFGNFAFEVNMSILSGDFGGIVFRADRVTTHFYSFLIKRDGSYSLKVYYDKFGNYNEIASGMDAPLNGTDLVGAVAQGNNIRIYVNRKRIVNVSDSTYTQGQIGIVTLSGEAAFSHAKVWTL